MRSTLLWTLLLSQILVGCVTPQVEQQAIPAPTPVASTAAFPIYKSATEVNSGEEVLVKWRQRKVERMESTSFDKTCTLTTKVGNGLLSGSALLKAMGEAGLDVTTEVRVLTVYEGESPDSSYSGMTVSDDEDDFLDNYLYRDGEGRLTLFVESEGYS